MKRSMKKLTAWLLAMVMVLAMSVTTFAATPATGTLTVNLPNGSLKGQTIYLFKLFDYKNNDPAEYTVNSNYLSALQTVTGKTGATGYDLYSHIATLGTTAEAGQITGIQKFANDFTKEVMKSGTITGTKNMDYFVSGDTESATTSYQFSDVAPGYYLVYLGGSESIQSSLITVDGDTNVDLKSETPTPEKEAYDSTGTTPKDDVQVGDVLTYKVTMQVPDISAFDADKYVFKLHDTLSDGLDFVTSDDNTVVNNGPMTVKVTVGDTEVTPPLSATVTGRKMTLDLAQVVKANQNNIGKDIVVTYCAKVNEDADINNTANSAQLEYSNDPSNTEETAPSVPDVEKTPTFAINVHKFEKGKDLEYLAGATFQLHAGTENGTVIKMAGTENNDGKYVVAANQESATLTDLVTIGSAAGNGYNLQINGLAAGTYYLVETKAPEGFNKAGAIKIVVTNTTKDDTPSYSITVGENAEAEADNIVDVENSRGAILPGTGGMGTMLFTAVGVILILGVGASFVVSRRRNEA